MKPTAHSPTQEPSAPSTEDAYTRHILGNYGMPPITLVRGEGSYVWDDTEKRYLDFVSGIAVMTVGHSHPVWVARVQEQAARLVHVSNLYRNQGQARLAERLTREAGPGRCFFCNSGAEANETLLKLARLHGARQSGKPGTRYRVVVAENAFHGRTFGGMAATPQAKIQHGFEPMLDGFATARLNDIDSFARAINEQTAAVFVETIQGEGGIWPCERTFLQDLRALCDDRGLLLMIDEVQCGIGRTGEFFAFQHHGVTPDAIGMAKGLGGGFPIGAVWIADRYADLFQPKSHGTTFGGSPLASAAALATLEILDEEQLLEHVRKTAPGFQEKIRHLAAQFPQHLGELRGLGFHLGITVHSDLLDLVARLRDNGLLVVGAGANTLRLLPPLNVSTADLDEAVDRIAETLKTMKA